MSTWIFLRGLAREAAHWGSFPEVFQQQVPAAHVITLDLPGNGQLHHLPSPLSIAAMVAFCRAELVCRGAPPPYSLLAMSMGAMVATEWAHQHPNELTACVLINTSFRPFNRVYQRLRPRNYGTLLRLVLWPASAAAIERTVLQLTSNCAAEHTTVIPVWTTARLRRPVSVMNALRQLMAAARFRTQAKPPAASLLLLGSENDQLVNIECTRAIAHRWHCTVALHPRAGHDLPLDDPLWVAEQVTHWLASQTPSSNSGGSNATE